MKTTHKHYLLMERADVEKVFALWHRGQKETPHQYMSQPLAFKLSRKVYAKRAASVFLSIIRGLARKRRTS